MTDFKILSYIRKWYIPIVVFSLLCCYLFNVYIQRQQTYTASVIISYVNPLASSGKTPTGAAIDVSQITASNVISGAISELDLSVSMDFIRSRMSVEPIIPEDEETRKQAILDRGEDYYYFPTNYLVTFRVGSDYSDEFARRVLEAVVRVYIKYYGEKYVDVKITPDSIGNTDNGSYDYLERVELIETGLDDIIAYLGVRSEAYPNFYCSTVGYSFGNMYDLYTELSELHIYKLYARILDDHITMDNDALLKKYQYRLDNALIAKTTYEEKIEGLTAVLDVYQQTDATVTTQSGTTEQTITDSAPTDDTEHILSGVAASHQSNQITTYDSLVNEYVLCKVELGKCEEEIEYCNRVLGIFSADDDGNTIAAREEIDAELAAVAAESDRLYATLITLIDEFNEYNSTGNITTKSTISVSEGMNTTLYTTIALAFFLVVGCVGSIVIGRLGEIAKNHLYVDPKTDLPNRLSCDNEIDRLSEKPLAGDVCCVSIQLVNLAAINENVGRKQGDTMLHNLGVILRHCGGSYGFIGYNGGPNFLCLFENCHYEKAQGFMEQVVKTVENYNKQYQDTPITIRYSIDESEHEGLYAVRDLIKHSLSQLYSKK